MRFTYQAHVKRRETASSGYSGKPDQRCGSRLADCGRVRKQIIATISDLVIQDLRLFAPPNAQCPVAIEYAELRSHVVKCEFPLD